VYRQLLLGPAASPLGAIWRLFGPRAGRYTHTPEVCLDINGKTRSERARPNETLGLIQTNHHQDRRSSGDELADACEASLWSKRRSSADWVDGVSPLGARTTA